MRSMPPTLLSLCLALVLAAPAVGQEPRPVGTWSGALEVSGTRLRLVLKISEEQGKLKATIDSVDQGAKDIPVDEVTLEARKLVIVQKQLVARFEGEFDATGNKVSGTWKQRGAELPLTFERTDKAPELRRPQEPKPPFPYVTEEVSYRNPNDGDPFDIGGTLVIPKGAGPHPVVLLITGSGPQDRDESLMGHRPFLVIADHLARHGIASLRCDDRGVGKTGGSHGTADSRDFAADAAAGVRYLQKRKEVDPKRIGLVGHSEGGLIAPLVATEHEGMNLAFLVLLAGPGVPGEDILYLQAELISRKMGVTDDVIAANRKAQEALFRIAREEPDQEKAAARMREVIEAQIATDATPEAVREQVRANLEAQIRAVNSRWFRFFLDFDPRKALAKVTCPVLALNGEHDLQVWPSQNLPEIAKALAGGKCRDWTTVQLPGLNHLFQECETGAPSEYSTIEQTFSPVALESISSWINARFGDPR